MLEPVAVDIVACYLGKVAVLNMKVAAFVLVVVAVAAPDIHSDIGTPVLLLSQLGVPVMDKEAANFVKDNLAVVTQYRVPVYLCSLVLPQSNQSVMTSTVFVPVLAVRHSG